MAGSVSQFNDIYSLLPATVIDGMPGDIAQLVQAKNKILAAESQKASVRQGQIPGDLAADAMAGMKIEQAEEAFSRLYDSVAATGAARMDGIQSYLARIAPAPSEGYAIPSSAYARGEIYNALPQSTDELKAGVTQETDPEGYRLTALKQAVLEARRQSQSVIASGNVSGVLDTVALAAASKAEIEAAGRFDAAFHDVEAAGKIDAVKGFIDRQVDKGAVKTLRETGVVLEGVNGMLEQTVAGVAALPGLVMDGGNWLSGKATGRQYPGSMAGATYEFVMDGMARGRTPLVSDKSPREETQVDNVSTGLLVGSTIATLPLAIEALPALVARGGALTANTGKTIGGLGRTSEGAAAEAASEGALANPSIIVRRPGMPGAAQSGSLPDAADVLIRDVVPKRSGFSGAPAEGAPGYADVESVLLRRPGAAGSGASDSADPLSGFAPKRPGQAPSAAAPRTEPSAAAPARPPSASTENTVAQGQPPSVSGDSAARAENMGSAMGRSSATPEQLAASAREAASGRSGAANAAQDGASSVEKLTWRQARNIARSEYTLSRKLELLSEKAGGEKAIRKLLLDARQNGITAEAVELVAKSNKIPTAVQMQVEQIFAKQTAKGISGWAGRKFDAAGALIEQARLYPITGSAKVAWAPVQLATTPLRYGWSAATYNGFTKFATVATTTTGLGIAHKATDGESSKQLMAYAGTAASKGVDIASAAGSYGLTAGEYALSALTPENRKAVETFVVSNVVPAAQTVLDGARYSTAALATMGAQGLGYDDVVFMPTDDAAHSLIPPSLLPFGMARLAAFTVNHEEQAALDSLRPLAFKPDDQTSGATATPGMDLSGVVVAPDPTPGMDLSGVTAEAANASGTSPSGTGAVTAETKRKAENLDVRLAAAGGKIPPAAPGLSPEADTLTAGVLSQYAGKSSDKIKAHADALLADSEADDGTDEETKARALGNKLVQVATDHGPEHGFAMIGALAGAALGKGAMNRVVLGGIWGGLGAVADELFPNLMPSAIDASKQWLGDNMNPEARAAFKNKMKNMTAQDWMDKAKENPLIVGALALGLLGTGRAGLGEKALVTACLVGVAYFIQNYFLGKEKTHELFGGAMASAERGIQSASQWASETFQGETSTTRERRGRSGPGLPYDFADESPVPKIDVRAIDDPTIKVAPERTPAPGWQVNPDTGRLMPAPTPI